VIDVLGDSRFIMTTGAKFTVNSITPTTQDGQTVKLALTDAVGGAGAEELLVQMKPDGTILFVDNAQLTPLSIDFGSTYYKVDGPR
jgi:hypothetical protein